MNEAGAGATSPAATLTRSLLIRNQRGLHARAAARFVKCVEQFQAEVTVTKNDMSVSGLSIMGLMMLAAGPGTTIEVTARGHDAEAALAALSDLVERSFGEM
jgi:phosphocarrier protein